MTRLDGLFRQLEFKTRLAVTSRLPGNLIGYSDCVHDASLAVLSCLTPVPLY